MAWEPIANDGQTNAVDMLLFNQLDDLSDLMDGGPEADMASLTHQALCGQTEQGRIRTDEPPWWKSTVAPTGFVDNPYYVAGGTNCRPPGYDPPADDPPADDHSHLGNISLYNSYGEEARDCIRETDYSAMDVSDGNLTAESGHRAVRNDVSVDGGPSMQCHTIPLLEEMNELPLSAAGHKEMDRLNHSKSSDDQRLAANYTLSNYNSCETIIPGLGSLDEIRHEEDQAPDSVTADSTTEEASQESNSTTEAEVPAANSVPGPGKKVAVVAPRVEEIREPAASVVNQPMPTPTTETSTPPPNICIRNRCSNLAIESSEWDREYCSYKCAIDHCKDVFNSWLKERK